MAEHLDNTVRENAAGPKRAASDSGSVEQHGLTEQIEADRYLASNEAAKSKGRGIRVTKLVPPGAS
jgi:creatinine amidohydrolase/Fe(II)-dependent formamide hydrolase-like protein